MADELNEQLEAAKSLLSSNGFQVKTEDEFNEALTNKLAVDKKHYENDFIKNFHTKFEESINEIVEVPKDTNEKSYQYAARMLKEYKSKISDLEGKSATADEKDKVIEKLKLEYQSLLDDSQNKLSTKDQELVNFKKATSIDAKLSTLKFKDSLDEDLMKTYIDNYKTSIINKSKLDDSGNLILLDDNGDTVLDKENNFNPVKVYDVIEQDFSKYLKPVNKKGPGSLKGDQNIPNGLTGIAQEASTGAKDFDSAIGQLMNISYAKKIPTGSKQFTEAFNSLEEYYKRG